MAINPATPVDLMVRWHPFPYSLDDTDVEAMLQVKLGEAWRALVGELPSIPARMDSFDVDAETVTDVLCAAVRRILTNPDGLARFNSSIDDYTEGGETDPATRSSDMFFTRAELRRLTPKPPAGAFTIRPGAS